jgi:hypothetical protein
VCLGSWVLGLRSSVFGLGVLGLGGSWGLGSRRVLGLGSWVLGLGSWVIFGCGLCLGLVFCLCPVSFLSCLVSVFVLY